jgi:hypothetical protein
VEEVLHQGATDAEISETLATKSVRYAFQILDELRALRGPTGRS